MTAITISLPYPVKEFVETQAVREGFGSVSEYLQSVIRQVQRRHARQELEAKLLEGLEGPVVEMTLEDWRSLRREALEDIDTTPPTPDGPGGLPAREA